MSSPLELISIIVPWIFIFAFMCWVYRDVNKFIQRLHEVDRAFVEGVYKDYAVFAKEMKEVHLKETREVSKRAIEFVDLQAKKIDAHNEHLHNVYTKFYREACGLPAEESPISLIKNEKEEVDDDNVS